MKMRVKRQALERSAAGRPASWLPALMAKAIAVDDDWVTFRTVDLKRAQRRPKGLGDWIESALTAVGIAQRVKRRWPNCGCAARRDRLNEWWAGWTARLRR